MADAAVGPVAALRPTPAPTESSGSGESSAAATLASLFFRPPPDEHEEKRKKRWGEIGRRCDLASHDRLPRAKEDQPCASGRPLSPIATLALTHPCSQRRQQHPKAIPNADSHAPSLAGPPRALHSDPPRRARPRLPAAGRVAQSRRPRRRRNSRRRRPSPHRCRSCHRRRRTKRRRPPRWAPWRSWLASAPSPLPPTRCSTPRPRRRRRR